MSELTTAQMLQVMGQEIAPQKAPLGLSALAALQASAESAKKMDIRVGEMTKALPQILVFLEEIQTLGPEVLSAPSDVDELTWADVAQKLKELLEARLTGQNMAVRRAVCVAMLRHWFNRPGEGALSKALDKAMEMKIFVPHKQGTVCCGKRKFEFSSDFGLKSEDKIALNAWLKAFCGETVEKKPEAKPEKAPASVPKLVTKLEEITPCQAWCGKIGKFDLPIPSNGHGKNGVLHMQAQEGGHMFVELTSRGFSDLESLSLPLSAIRDEKSGKFRDGLRLAPKSLPPWSLAAWQGQMERLGAVLKAGFQPLVEGKKGMDPNEFLTTERVGDSILTFEGFNWKPRSGEGRVFESLSLRVERRADGQIALVEILTPEAELFFGKAVGQWQDPGQAFDRINPLILKVFLRAVYGQVVQKRAYA